MFHRSSTRHGPAGWERAYVPRCPSNSDSRRGPSPTVDVRDLAWEDFEGWVGLYYSRYEEVRTNPELGVYTFESKPTLGEEAELFGKVWKDVLAGDLVVSVGDEGGRIVGICSVYRAGRHREDRHAGILAIAVHPDWRGRGVGSRLIPHALKKCEGKFELVRLTVTEVNLPARALYRKCGFVESGRLPRAFKRNDAYFDDIVMWRPVGEPGRPTSSAAVGDGTMSEG